LFLDQGRMEQILVNLLSNAAKFTENGEISVLSQVGDDVISVAVKDTGIGIPSEKLGDLFEVFTQVNHSAHGTGLGLSISRRLAQMMGGDIRVESEIGTGSTFTVTLPIKLQRDLRSKMSESQAVEHRELS
ncbi:MAG: ATP-binding protein, partial [Desulfobulbia bacterium]